MDMIKNEEKLWLSIEEGMGTDGEFFANAYISKTEQEAIEMCSSLIADMAETMEWEKVDPATDWEIGNDEWWYRVRVQQGN